MVRISNFDVEDIENTIKKYVREFGVQMVYFDYLHSTDKLLSNQAVKTKISQIREDQLLYSFSERMKTLAKILGIHIDTSTQLNGKERGQIRLMDQKLCQRSKGNNR